MVNFHKARRRRRWEKIFYAHTNTHTHASKHGNIPFLLNSKHPPSNIIFICLVFNYGREESEKQNREYIFRELFSGLLSIETSQGHGLCAFYKYSLSLNLNLYSVAPLRNDVDNFSCLMDFVGCIKKFNHINL